MRAEAGETFVEVAHETLFGAWPTIASWLDEEQAFLADIERVKSAHEAWSEVPPESKPQALLQGLLLAHARDWLVKYPQRFIGREMEKLQGFVDEAVYEFLLERQHKTFDARSLRAFLKESTAH